MINIKKNRFIKIIYILIMIIIIIHLLSNYLRIIGYKNNLVPTGNVDIFDINCNCQNDNENEKDEKPVLGESDGLVVYDKNVFFGEGELKIFENPAYEYKEIIAPGSSNTYQFIIRNNNPFDMEVNFNTAEVNKNNVKLKFRLRENNKYIIGDSSNWVTIKDLKYSNIKINSMKYKTYSLDWKWEYSESKNQDKIDTFIGFDAVDKYKLLINIKAKMLEDY